MDFAKDIEDKISFIFENFKLLPDYTYADRAVFTFIAQPRQSDTFGKLKNILSGLKSGIEVEDSSASKNSHQFFMGDYKVNILYSKNEESFNFFYDISSYGITSILGKVLKRFDLKLTQDGLLYEEKLGIATHQSKIGDFCITNDSRKFFELLELDYDRFLRGFDIQEDLFKFISKTPCLKPEKFTNPKKEHSHPLFLAFQTHLIKHQPESNYKRLTFDDIDNHFEDIDFHMEVETLKMKERRKRESIGKFSGKTILEFFPNFEKKKIGTSMHYFKYSFKDIEEYRDFLLDFTIDEVMARFLEVVEPDLEKQKELTNHIVN